MRRFLASAALPLALLACTTAPAGVATAPVASVEPAPLFVFPPKLLAIAKWLPHYFFPWNAIFAASAVARHAPIGKPPPIALAIAMMSGVTPTFW